MKFFEKALKSIGDHLADLLKRPECKGADTILMVGGFSESPLLQEFIKNKLVFVMFDILDIMMDLIQDCIFSPHLLKHSSNE